jgi:HPt (histidine-containing phosphotransfer) domain-containing protein
MACVERERPPSVAATEPAGPVVDGAVLDQLAADLGAEQVRDICALFLRDAGARVPVIRDAIEAGDAETAGRAAHRLKSAGGFVGAQALAARCATVERLATSGRMSEAKALSGPLVVEFERTSEEMAVVLAELGSHRWSAATP